MTDSTSPLHGGSRLAPGDRLGRYRLLARDDGDGARWSAWDPELERRVAVDLVAGAGAADRARIVRAGRIAARITHPNVVSIYDVGEVGTTVYLVSEWVQGTPLRAFAAAVHGRAAVVEAYRQAGEGLAAAHGVGAIHGGFPGERTLCDADGRVRVGGFGRAGDDVTSTTDLRAWLAALAEAMAATGEIPDWLARLLAADSPPPTMAAALDALPRARVARRRRVIAAVAVVAVVATAFAVGMSRSHPLTPTVVRCDGGADELAATWGPTPRAAALDAWRAHGPGSAPLIATALDGFATAWTAEHRRACVAHQLGALSDAGYEAHRGCLIQTRARLAAVSELVRAAGRAEEDGVIVAARSLPDVTACADAPTVAPPPPAQAEAARALAGQLERVAASLDAGDPSYEARAHAATVASRALGYPPLVARALLLEGRAHLYDADHALPAALLAEATTTALAAGDDVLAVEAYARWIFVSGPQASALGSWTAMAALADRLGEPGRFARALLYHNRYAALVQAGDLASALATVRAARHARGDVHFPELDCIESSLGTLAVDVGEAEDVWRTARARYRTGYGPLHFNTIRMDMLLATVGADQADALARLRAVCPSLDVWWFGVCASELGWRAELGGDRATALAAMRAVAAFGDAAPSPYRELAAAYLAVVERRPDAAARIAAVPPRRGSSSAELIDARWTWGFAAWLAEQRGDHAGALAVWGGLEDALAAAQQHDKYWLSAHAHAALAEGLARSQPMVARRHAAIAAAWYRRAPSNAALVSQLDAIAAGAR